MTANELTAYFSERILPTGHVKFSTFEATDNVPHLVNLAFARIKAGGQGADTARGMLLRLHTYLEKQV